MAAAEAAAVDQGRLAGLGVAQHHRADRRQLLVARVDDLDEDEIVAGGGGLERVARRVAEEIGDQEQHGAPLERGEHRREAASRISRTRRRT